MNDRSVTKKSYLFSFQIRLISFDKNQHHFRKKASFLIECEHFYPVVF
jgi:hypothetical protein